MDLVTARRKSIPSAGRTVAAATEVHAVHVRKAVEILRSGQKPGIDSAFRDAFGPRWHVADGDAVPIGERAAWALVNMLLIARLEHRGNDFDAAESWFLLERHKRLSSFVSERAKKAAVASISNIDFDDGLEDLLPYVLEPHGPGSRLSVMKDPTTRTARTSKKVEGVFYTPADVAEFIVDTVAGSLDAKANFLDPSCGTGVFLLALLRNKKKRFNYVVDHLYGIDSSALSIDTCAFLILHACRDTYAIPPWCAWHLIRMNLAVYDATRLHDYPFDLSTPRRALRRDLLSGEVAEAVNVPCKTVTSSSEAPGHDSIWRFFPEAVGGFNAVVGNPPYACLGVRNDSKAIGYSANANLYPFFVEMMWRLTKPTHRASGLVVPLSIAYHQGPQFAACRRMMANVGGHWRCAFFDREPHALFGEDVKTRNAILFHSGGNSSTAQFSVTPLIKWTSRTRQQLFNSLKFTDLGRTDIESGIPKVGSEVEAKALSRLAREHSHLAEFWTAKSSCSPTAAIGSSGKLCVFVASTAYNFLNVFRPYNASVNGFPLSENKVHRLDFDCEQDARIAFAVLSSTLVFWLWHATCDGFHVSGRFLNDIPFGRNSLPKDSQRRLASLGAQMWKTVQKHRIVSVNRGRQTIAFRPLACMREREEIDYLLVRTAHIPSDFTATLREFVEKTVVVDGHDKRRGHLRRYFNSTEITS